MATRETDAFASRHRRALEDNEEGRALLVSAVVRAIEAGFAAAPGTPGDEHSELGQEQLWDRWLEQRNLTPEARAWPDRLASRRDPPAKSVLQTATDAVVGAGRELGLTGAAGRRGTAIELRELGEQAAEAGSALAHVLSQPDEPLPGPGPLVIEEADVAENVREELIDPDGHVRVATAGSEVEAEMLRGVLETAGIPSVWQEPAGYMRIYLGVGGYREIYVAPSDADEARALLAKQTPPRAPAGKPPRRERKTRRLVAVLLILLFMGSNAVFAFAVSSTAGIVVTALTVLAIIALLIWNDRVARR